MEIEKVVESKFNEIIQSGFIEDKIKSALEKTISDSIDESLKSWSDFGKKIKSSIQEALKTGKLEITIPEYNQLVSNWIIDMVNKTIISDSKKQIEENIARFFKPLEKDEYKISEIIEEFKKSITDDGNECSGKITFISDESSVVAGYKDFYFDKESNKSKYACEYSFGIDDRGLWKMNIDGCDAVSARSPNLYGFDSFMFQLFASKVKIIDDSNNVVTGYGQEY